MLKHGGLECGSGGSIKPPKNFKEALESLIQNKATQGKDTCNDFGHFKESSLKCISNIPTLRVFKKET